jgi:apolipoprotein D and lipocalin family protein
LRQIELGDGLLHSEDAFSHQRAAERLKYVRCCCGLLWVDREFPSSGILVRRICVKQVFDGSQRRNNPPNPVIGRLRILTDSAPLISMRSRTALLILLTMSLFGCATSKPPLKTVRHVDLPRYMGDWRVIANIPYFAERDCVDSIESYALRPDGRIANWFRCRKKSFDAPQKRFDFVGRVTNRETNAEWKIRFAPLINVSYLIIDLDPEYRWTVVGHPSRKYGWIMHREKSMPEATYRGILARLDAQGYDSKAFVKVPQLPSQLPAVSE